MSTAKFPADPKLKWEGGRESLFVTGVGLNQCIFTMSGVNVVSTGKDMGAHWLGHRLPVDTASYLLSEHYDLDYRSRRSRGLFWSTLNWSLIAMMARYGLYSDLK